MSGRSSRIVFCQNVPADDRVLARPGAGAEQPELGVGAAGDDRRARPQARLLGGGRGDGADHGAGVVHRREHAGVAGRRCAAISSDQVRSASAEHPRARAAGRLGGQHAGQPGRDPVAEHAHAAGRRQDVRPVPGEPAQPGRRGDRHPVAADARRCARPRPRAISSTASWPERESTFGHAQISWPARVVEHDALAHAGRRDRARRRRRSRPRRASASRMQAAIASQLAATSKSWPPGASGGSRWIHSRRLAATCSPFSVNSTARQLPVPASIASR